MFDSCLPFLSENFSFFAQAYLAFGEVFYLNRVNSIQLEVVFLTKIALGSEWSLSQNETYYTFSKPSNNIIRTLYVHVRMMLEGRLFASKLCLSTPFNLNNRRYSLQQTNMEHDL